jgi:hypothetical protein
VKRCLLSDPYWLSIHQWKQLSFSNPRDHKRRTRTLNSLRYQSTDSCPPRAIYYPPPPCCPLLPNSLKRLDKLSTSGGKGSLLTGKLSLSTLRAISNTIPDVSTSPRSHSPPPSLYGISLNLGKPLPSCRYAPVCLVSSPSSITTDACCCLFPAPGSSSEASGSPR